MGRRFRLQVRPVTGSYQWIEYLADYRRYDPIIFNYLTIATRLYTDLSIGQDEEAFPKYIARPDFVRGYDRNSSVLSVAVRSSARIRRTAAPCSCSAAAWPWRTSKRAFRCCAAWSSGSRRSSLPPIDGLFFYDAGLAWSRGQKVFGARPSDYNVVERPLSGAQLRRRAARQPVQLRDPALGLRHSGRSGRPTRASGRGRSGRASSIAAK